MHGQALTLKPLVVPLYVIVSPSKASSSCKLDMGGLRFLMRKQSKERPSFSLTDL